MTIETKFNIGDEVWFIEDRRVCRGQIESVTAKTSGHGNDYEYYDIVMRSDVFEARTSAEAHQIFKTKEELIESLFN